MEEVQSTVVLLSVVVLRELLFDADWVLLVGWGAGDNAMDMIGTGD